MGLGSLSLESNLATKQPWYLAWSHSPSLLVRSHYSLLENQSVGLKLKPSLNHTISTVIISSQIQCVNQGDSEDLDFVHFLKILHRKNNAFYYCFISVDIFLNYLYRLLQITMRTLYYLPLL